MIKKYFNGLVLVVLLMLGIFQCGYANINPIRVVKDANNRITIYVMTADGPVTNEENINIISKLEANYKLGPVILMLDGTGLLIMSTSIAYWRPQKLMV